jgi:hypothetical protein
VPFLERIFACGLQPWEQKQIPGVERAITGLHSQRRHHIAPLQPSQNAAKTASLRW